MIIINANPRNHLQQTPEPKKLLRYRLEIIYKYDPCSASNPSMYRLYLSDTLLSLVVLDRLLRKQLLNFALDLEELEGRLDEAIEQECKVNQQDETNNL